MRARSAIPRPASLRPGLRNAWGAVLVLGLSMLLALTVATPASAHPFFADGGRVPVQSLATIELDLAHGCGDERTGGGRDTDEVALEVPTWLRIIDVPEPEGWTVSIEEPTAAARGVVLWSATTGAEPAPRFAVTVVVDGEAGETRMLRVSQRCGDLVERWIGTPDEPADQPAVRLRLEEADPSSPPPPAPEPAPEPAPAPVAPASPEAHQEPAPPAGSDAEPGAANADRRAVLLVASVVVGIAALGAIVVLFRRRP